MGYIFFFKNFMKKFNIFKNKLLMRLLIKLLLFIIKNIDITQVMHLIIISLNTINPVKETLVFSMCIYTILRGIIQECKHTTKSSYNQ